MNEMKTMTVKEIVKSLRGGTEVRELEDSSGGWEADHVATDKIMRRAADKLEELASKNEEMAMQLLEAQAGNHIDLLAEAFQQLSEMEKSGYSFDCMDRIAGALSTASHRGWEG